MPQATAITVVNLTAGDKTFTPLEISAPSATYEDLSGSALDARYALHLDRPLKSNEVRRTYRLKYPVVRPVDGVDTVVGIRTGIVSVITPRICTAAERAEVLADLGAVATDSSVQAVFNTPEWVY